MPQKCTALTISIYLQSSSYTQSCIGAHCSHEFHTSKYSKNT